jgi:hypothetical protein
MDNTANVVAPSNAGGPSGAADPVDDSTASKAEDGYAGSMDMMGDEMWSGAEGDTKRPRLRLAHACDRCR